MENPYEPTKIEAFCDNTELKIVTDMLPILNPALALIPSLRNAIAGKLQATRVQEALIDINKRLESLELGDLNEQQMQQITDLVNCVLNTADSKRLEYLKIAIFNTVQHGVDDHISYALTRAIRELSPLEMKWLIETRHCKKISDTGKPEHVQTLHANKGHSTAVSEDTAYFNDEILRASTGRFIALGIVQYTAGGFDSQQLFTKLRSELVKTITMP